MIGQPTMLKIGGKFQRCPECGANVFTHVQETPRNKYSCNGCQAQYVDGGEDEKEEDLS